MKTENYNVFGTKVTRISPKRLKRLKRKFHILELNLEIRFSFMPAGAVNPSLGFSIYAFLGNRDIFDSCSDCKILFCNPINMTKYAPLCGIFKLTKNKRFRDIETSLFISDRNEYKNCYLAFNTKRDLLKFKLAHGV